MTAPRDALAQLEAVLALSEKATGGPWQPKNEYDYDEIIGAIDGPDDGQMGYTHICTTQDTAEEMDNARIIVAAVNWIRDHAETLRALLGAADGVRLTESDVVALVAGPYMYHHKMNDLQTRYAEGFDRCREMTIDSIKTRFAIEATLTKAPANDCTNKESQP